MGEAEHEVVEGEGYSLAHLDDLGDGYGFRKVRKALGVDAFGVNAIVLPPGAETGRHFHDRQQELYFVHSGRLVFELGDDQHEVEAGGLVRVDAATVRGMRNPSDSEDAVYLIVGGAGGYVGRDGRLPEGETRGGG